MSEPIIAGFYPDPTICRVGDDYYLANSSFEYFPGVPLWHSRDLVSWTQLGHILTRRSQFARGDGRPSSGIYAGTLRHHDGRFVYVTTNASDLDAGQLIVHADRAAGPWSDPIRVPEAIGIDPDLAWDADGQCFLTWKAMDFRTETGILQARLDLATGRLLDAPYPVWQGSGLDAVEGPHLYEVGGTWYLLLAEGGTERGHAVTVARGSRPDGPFEPCPDNPILTSRSTISPVQNTGHADLVQTAQGRWAAVYLGARPRGSTPGFHVLGRETFIAGMDWIEGWPVFHPGRDCVPPVHTGFVERFAGPELDPRWIVAGGEPEATAAVASDGGIRILPASPGTGAVGLLCTRVRDLRWRAEAVLDERGRFEVRIDDRHAYGLVRDAASVRATARIGDLAAAVGRVVPVDGPVTLRIEAVDPDQLPVPLGHAGPDDIVLTLVSGDRELELARLDGRYLSAEVASGFTGRMLALGTTDGPATFRRVSYQPAGSEVGGATNAPELALAAAEVAR
jgi:hypothetical protein